MTDVLSFFTQWHNNQQLYLVNRSERKSYSSCNILVASIRDYFNQEGITDQNVAILMCNSAAYVLTYFANRANQSTNIPINPKLTITEIASELSYCDCNWLITMPQFRMFCSKIADLSGVGIIELQEDMTSTIISRPWQHRVRRNSGDIVVMLHTSGTTGDPKKVMLSEKNLVANTHSHLTSLGLTKDDVVLIALPMFFGYCHTSQLLTHTRLGSTVVIYDHPLFTAKRFCELVQSNRVTCFTAVPAMLALLDKYTYLSRYDLSSLRYICYGGANTSPDILSSLMRKLPTVGFVNTYGQTECSPRVTALLPEDCLRKAGSIGLPIPGVEVRVVNEQGKPVAIDEVGEICVTGENVTPGYYKKPIESAAIIQDGFLHTADLARLDNEGYLYLVGRKKTVIISGGINIYPEEVEQVLLTLPFIEDAIVYGEDDPMLGEKVVTKIVPKDGAVITLEMIHKGLDNLLAQYKRPKKLYLTHKLTKTATGKKQRITKEVL